MESGKEGNGEGEWSNTSPSCCLLLAVGRFVKRGVLEEKPENVLAAGARTSPPSAWGLPRHLSLLCSSASGSCGNFPSCLLLSILLHKCAFFSSLT